MPHPTTPRRCWLVRAQKCAVALVGVSLFLAGGARLSPAQGEKAGGAAGDAVLDSTATLADYVVWAIAMNPLLQSYADAYRASSEVPKQARALPDPMVTYGYGIETVETRVGPQEHMVMVSQQFPFFGKRSLRGQMAEKEAEVWGRTYDEKVLDLVQDVKKAYYEYYRAHAVLQITSNEKNVIRQMQEVAQVKYAAGRVGQQDVLKAQLALSDLETRLTMTRAELVGATARLNALLNREPDAPLAPPRPEAFDPDAIDVDRLVETSLARRPELAGAGSEIAMAERANALARKEYYPDLDLSFSYTFVGERKDMLVPESGHDAIQVRASLNLPIWLGKLRAGVRETEARIAAAKNRRAGLQTTIKSDVRDALARVRSAHDQVTLFEGVILPQARQTFLASEAGYRTGKVDFLDYLDSERMLLSLTERHAELVAMLGRELADLERATGAPLPPAR